MCSERLIPVNGVDLCVEAYGAAADPAVLLVMGGAASMDFWPVGFCQRLAAGGRFVIRYDHRDTGRSTSYEPGRPAYAFIDLVADGVGILDALDVGRAHIVGMSMGGAIAQTLAIERPERVASLILMSTSPIESVDRELPSMSAPLRDRFDTPPPEPDWDDREAVVDYLVAGELPFLGSVRSDPATLREKAGRVVDRTANLASSRTNHWILDERPVRGRLADVTAPTLVLHGTEDPLFPYEHGEALADAIPGARLIPLPGVGHEAVPPPVWDDVVPALLRHTAATTWRGHTMDATSSVDILPLLERTYAGAADAIAAATPAALDAPSPCEGWTVRDVAKHIVIGLETFTRTLEGSFDPAEARADEPDPDYLGGDPVAAYRLAAGRNLAAFGRPGVLDQEFDFVFGPTPGRGIANISLQESLIHGWDIARGAAVPFAPDPAAVDAVAAFNADVAGDDVRRRGMFGPPQPSPPDASDFEALLARLGRRP